MAHIDTGGSKGGARKTNIELNLVPFIDLMSVLIIFLLITAVWTQISIMNIGSSIYGKKGEGEKQEPLELPPYADVVLKLDILDRGYILTVGANAISIVKIRGLYDNSTLEEQLQIAKRMYPEKVDAIVTMEDELKYEYLIKGMDSLLKSGFSSISVATGGPQ